MNYEQEQYGVATPEKNTNHNTDIEMNLLNYLNQTRLYNILPISCAMVFKEAQKATVLSPRFKISFPWNS